MTTIAGPGKTIIAMPASVTVPPTMAITIRLARRRPGVTIRRVLSSRGSARSTMQRSLKLRRCRRALALKQQPPDPPSARPIRYS